MRADGRVAGHLETGIAKGSAKRIMVGFGSGRSTVAGRLVFEDADQKALADVRIRVRGKLLFSSYQDDKMQRRQASSAFERKLTEEIARLK